MQRIVRSPAVLVVHLKRFSYDNQKIHDHVGFPVSLDLTLYVHQPQPSAEEGKQQQQHMQTQPLEQEHQQEVNERQLLRPDLSPTVNAGTSTTACVEREPADMKDASLGDAAATNNATGSSDPVCGAAVIDATGPLIYTLQAVLVHEGETMQSGHYLAYVRVSTGWLRISDASIGSATDAEVHEQAAYMLFYKKSPVTAVHEKVRSGAGDRRSWISGSIVCQRLLRFGSCFGL